MIRPYRERHRVACFLNPHDVRAGVRQFTQTFAVVVFLVQRGLAAGIALSAPAIVLSVVLGWPFRTTTLVMGGLVVLYTTLGGIAAVTWADVQQMVVIFAALILALGIAIAGMLLANALNEPMETDGADWPAALGNEDVGILRVPPALVSSR